ncbi:MAG: hypothetical protein ACO3JG_11025 [Luteolibacter sp.]
MTGISIQVAASIGRLSPALGIAVLTAASLVRGQESKPPVTGSPEFRPVDSGAASVIPAVQPLATPLQPALIPLILPPDGATVPSNDQSMPKSTAAPALPETSANDGAESSEGFAEDASALSDGAWTNESLLDSQLWATAVPGPGSSAIASSGFDGGWNAPLMAAWPGESLLNGLSLSSLLNATYDSNPYRGYNSGGAGNEQSDFFVTLGGSVGYQSKASIWTYAANYNGSYNWYLNNSDLGGYQQNAGAQANYDGGRLNATLRAGIDFGSGANRYYASVVDQISYNWGLNSRYALSSKTSLTGGVSQNFSSASGGSNADTSSTNFDLSALWHYSQLTKFGPGIRYTMRSGQSGGDRTSLGPTFTVNYQLSRKVSFNSRVGTDFVHYEEGGSADPSLFTSIGLNYRPSVLWSMNLSLQRDSQASLADAGRFEEITALRLGYQRRIRRLSWNLGASLESRSTENIDATRFADIPDRDYISFDTSLGMPVFSNSVQASLFLRYSKQDGRTNESWDSFQTGFGLSHRF